MSAETTRIRQQQHAAAVRMARFDNQSPAVREVLRYARDNIRIPFRPLTLARALARALAPPSG